jgi:hypothetical protein
MTTHVWLSFPAVDIVNPEENGIVERIVRLLQGYGLTAEFVVPGVKVQHMLADSPSTIELLNSAEMTIGYQGNNHSLHPGLMEYVESTEWDDGVAEVRRRETQWANIDGSTDPSRRGGILLLADTFGPRFTSFRGAGGWSPQIMDVLRELGITVHHTLFSLAEATGRTAVAYLGCLQFSPGRARWTGNFPYDSPLTNRLELENIIRRPQEGLPIFIDKFERMLDNYAFAGPRLMYVNFHPSYLFTDLVSDQLNWSNGEMPDPPDNLVRSNLLPGPEQERRWEVFRSIVDWVAARRDIDFVTSRSFVKASTNLAPTFTPRELDQLAGEVVRSPLMRPPAGLSVGSKHVSVAEAFTFLQTALVGPATDRPDELQAVFRLGPRDFSSAYADRTVDATVGAVIDAASQIGQGPIPTEVELAGGPVAPYPFLQAMSRAYLWRDDPDRRVLVRPADFETPELAESFNHYLYGTANWRLYKRNLDVSRIAKHGALQLWTYKPVDVTPS